MSMKKKNGHILSIVMICLALLSYSGFVSAQVYQPGPGQNQKDKIKALKVAFITNRLALTSQEAQGFWPAYNEKQQKEQAIGQERRKLLKEARDGYFSMSDGQMEGIVKELFDLKQQELDLEKQYYEIYKKVLPIKKIVLLMKVEKDFNAEVLKQAINRAEE